MKYLLENLSPRRFNQLCQSLLSKSFPLAQCRPVSQLDDRRHIRTIGDDRDQTQRVAYQLKYARNPLTPDQPHKSIINQLRTEIPLLSSKINAEHTTYILLTNVPAQLALQDASIAKLKRIISEHVSVPTQCWWRDDIERLLDAHWKLKWAFPEVFGNTEILRIIAHQHLTTDFRRPTQALRKAIRDQFNYDKEARFQQLDLQNELLDLFIDVPVDVRDHDRGIDALRWRHTKLSKVPRHRKSLSLHHSTKTGAATLLLDALAQEEHPRIVIEGAPGQGKSTIVQYICQVHRQRILGEGATDRRIPKDHRNSPIKLPFKVYCRDLAVWLSGGNPFITDSDRKVTAPAHRTIETFLCAQITYHSRGLPFEVSDLHAIARVFAILVVFDGLDEIANMGERAKVVEEIARGVPRLQDSSLSLQTVVTSRPAAFPNSPGFKPDEFLYLQLRPIDKPTIIGYAEKWIRARKLSDRASMDVRKILSEKLDEPHLRDLAGNPMQLSILINLIHRQGASLPDKRTDLYEKYMDVFCDRETDKSDIMRERRGLLMDLHAYLAWMLHSEAQVNKTGGRIESERLRETIKTYLEKHGHGTELLDSLFLGVVERVVAIVSRLEGSYEFEVQPLREYFAARYLYDTVTPSTAQDVNKGSLPERFEVLAQDFFWQNVTRFYAGCYSRGELPSLVRSLLLLDSNERFMGSRYVQSLAINLLTDYTFSQYPIVIGEMLEYLLNMKQFRTVVVSQGDWPRADALYLPKDNGREELVKQCFACAVEADEDEYVEVLFDIIAANTEMNDRRYEWWACLREIDDSQRRTRWIANGLRLSVIQTEDSAKVDALIAEEAGEYRERVLRMGVGGGWEFIRSNETHLSAALDAVLDSVHEMTIYRLPNPLQYFAMALSSDLYSLAFQNMSEDPLGVVLKRDFGLGEVGEYDCAHECDGDVWRRLREFLRGYRKLCDAVPLKVWATSLEPWTELTELGRSLYGDRWVFDVLASSGSGIVSKGERCEDASEVHDRYVAVVRRARHARMRAGQWRWWLSQLVGAKWQREIAFLLLLLFRWAGRSVLLRLKAEIEGRLRELDSEWWGNLIAALGGVGWSRQRTRAILVAGDELGQGMSERMAVCLWGRAADKARVHLFERHLNQYRGEDAEVLRFSQDVALWGLVGAEMGGWERLLSGISDRHLMGVGSTVAARSWWYFIGRKELPLSACEEIMENSNGYPIGLVGWAERVCRTDIARRRLVPVSKVAERGKWFEATIV